MKSVRYSCPILMKFEFSRQFLEKYSNMNVYENPSSGSQVVSFGQFGQIRFSQFCERA